MKKYYVNKNAQHNGDHEVHKEGCPYLALMNNKIDLGLHLTCSSAVRKAKTYYLQSNGCKTCSEGCHTS